jgi:hypothetical protein
LSFGQSGRYGHRVTDFLIDVLRIVFGVGLSFVFLAAVAAPFLLLRATRRWRWRRRYLTYLKSPAWAAKREWYRARRPWRCAVCGSGHRLQLHHRTYRRVARERLDDLEPLCPEHHRARHGLPPVSEDSAGEVA